MGRNSCILSIFQAEHANGPRSVQVIQETAFLPCLETAGPPR